MLNIAILGSGNGSNCQAIIDAINYSKLNANVSCIISDVKDARILTRAKHNQIPSLFYRLVCLSELF